MLLDNTDWSKVRRLVIHDDGSDEQEGTVNLVESMIDGWQTNRRTCPVEFMARPWETRLGSPPAVMNWYLEEFGDAERFAKIDSDIVVPPDWLNNLTTVMDAYPELELLGMEAGRHGPPGHNGTPFAGVYSYEPATHIGGVGLMRTSAFEKHPAMFGQGGRFGFTEWQHEYQPVRGFVCPDLLVSELSRIPFEPWAGYAASYFERDWERDWPKYHPRWDYWWSWWPK
jgi:hypothetical protein